MKTYQNITVSVNGTPIKDYISFIWTDRYNTCGDFELEVPFTAENNKFYKHDQIVTCNLSSNRMIIEDIKISISAENGERMLLSGRDYSSVLDRRVVAFTQIYDTNFFDNNKFYSAFSAIFDSCFKSGREQVLTTGAPDPNRKDYKDAAIYNNSRKVEISVASGSDPYGHIKNAEINIDATGKSVLELLEAHCQAKDFGFKMSGNTCIIYDGTKRGTLFSMSKGNLVSADYSSSKQNYKNAAYIQGEEYQANKNKVEVNGDIVIVDELEPGTAVLLSPEATDENPIYYRASVRFESASGLNRREMYIDSSKNIGQNSNPKYVARLEAEGRVELLKNHCLETQASCEVMHDPNVIYGQDYNLGDIVTIGLSTLYDPMNKSGSNQAIRSIQMRVNEFTISHSDAGLDLYPTFVAYDPEKYVQSNISDSGVDPTEGPDSGYPSEYGKYARIEFDFNGGHLNAESESGTYFIPESRNLKPKGLINGKYRPNYWYVLPESLESGIGSVLSITGFYCFQQFGDFVTGPNEEPIKEHYIFQGWYDVDTGRKLEDHIAGDDQTGYIIQTSNITFKAKWQIEKYDITFDHGDGGRFTSSYGLNDSGQIVVNLPWGSYPSPPGVISEPGYHAANPQWSPEIKMVESAATYTAQWEQDEENNEDDIADPEDADYENDDLPTRGVKDNEKSSTKDTEGNEDRQFGLIHFVGPGSMYKEEIIERKEGQSVKNDQIQRYRVKYGLSNWNDTRYGADIPVGLYTEHNTNQSYANYYSRNLKNGITLHAWMFDPWGLDPGYETYDSKNPEKYEAYVAKAKFGRISHAYFGIAMVKEEGVVGLWSWGDSTFGGYHYLPEVAFNPIPIYIPYYEYSTLLDGYNRGDIHYGLLHLAPVFIPFKYYRKIRINNVDTYWMLCVPPIDWISNWQSYYYLYEAGYYVGFTCQYYDNQGNLLSPGWSNSNGVMALTIISKGLHGTYYPQRQYGTYYDGEYKSGPNTISNPNSVRLQSSTHTPGVNFRSSWTEMGWKWRKIPKERFNATTQMDRLNPSGSQKSFSDYESYEGPLLIPFGGPTQNRGDSDAAESITEGWGTDFYHTVTMGMKFGPRFEGYSDFAIKKGYLSGWGSWPEKYRDITDDGTYGDDVGITLFKQSGQVGLAARVIQQINNVISKSKSLSYFTYKIWLPLVSKIKSTTWYVSSDGENWHIISWAHGNSIKIKTTDKTVAEQQAAGLTGADAIVGTNGSYYKSEVRYTDEDGNEFLQTSDVGQLRIDDTDISGADIEMGQYMNPDGTTNGVDIETDASGFMDNIDISKLTNDQKIDIENMFNSGSTAKQIADATGIPESIINIFINKSK